MTDNPTDLIDSIEAMEIRLNSMVENTANVYPVNETWMPIITQLKKLLPPFENTDIIIRLENLVKEYKQNMIYFVDAGVPAEALKEGQQAEDLERVIAALRIIRKIIARTIVE